MKVGDLVRRIGVPAIGVVLSLQPDGRPVHPCATVYWFERKKSYGMALAILEVISEGR